MQLIAWRKQSVPVDIKSSIDTQCNFKCELLNNRIFLIKGNYNGNTYFLRNRADSIYGCFYCLKDNLIDWINTSKRRNGELFYQSQNT